MSLSFSRNRGISVPENCRCTLVVRTLHPWKPCGVRETGPQSACVRISGQVSSCGCPSIKQRKLPKQMFGSNSGSEAQKQKTSRQSRKTDTLVEGKIFHFASTYLQSFVHIIFLWIVKSVPIKHQKEERYFVANDPDPCCTDRKRKEYFVGSVCYDIRTATKFALSLLKTTRDKLQCWRPA